MKNVNLELEMLLWQLTEKNISTKKLIFYGLWNSYFDFGSPQQQVDMLARSKKL